MAKDTTIQIVKEDPKIEAYKLALLKEAQALSKKDLADELPIYQIAGMDPLQTRALELAEQGIGAYEPYMTDADVASAASYGALTSGVDPSQLTELTQQYMTPYMDAVGAEINRAYDIQQAQQAGQSIGQGAFGGSRAALLQNEIDRDRTSALAKAQADAYMNAQQAASGMMDRSLQGGQALGTLALQQAGLGELLQQLGQKETQYLYDVGKAQQAQDQAVLEAERMSDLQSLYQPYQNLAFLSDIYKGAPSSQMSLTSTTAPQASPFQTYLGLGIGGLSAAAGAKEAGLF